MKMNNNKNMKKKGVLSFETVIGLLMFLVLLAILLDMLTLSNRYMGIHDTVKELSRTIAVQGGSLSNKPEGYPNNYYNSINLANLVDRSMKISGFKGNDYKIYITYSKYITDNNGNITTDESYQKDFMTIEDGEMTVKDTDKIDYLNDFNVTIIAEYDWIFSKLPLGLSPAILKSSAPGVSEWKYNYDKWDSEN
ncbi:hypothetical protein [Hungatella hathewayi]|uniref:hypothetical protein n=1 Tax=Hungatella hathewayi TaxID=154046 RepID=UPI0035644CEB